MDRVASAEHLELFRDIAATFVAPELGTRHPIGRFEHNRVLLVDLATKCDKKQLRPAWRRDELPVIALTGPIRSPKSPKE